MPSPRRVKKSPRKSPRKVVKKSARKSARMTKRSYRIGPIDNDAGALLLEAGRKPKPDNKDLFKRLIQEVITREAISVNQFNLLTEQQKNILKNIMRNIDYKYRGMG